MTRLRQTIARRHEGRADTAAMLTTFNEVDMTHINGDARAVQGCVREEAWLEARLHGLLHQGRRAGLKTSRRQRRDRRHRPDLQELLPHRPSPSHRQGWSCLSSVTATTGRSPTSKIDRRFRPPRRDGQLKIDEMQGGTFTITNGGIYGSLMSTPILNAPQSGILGMHKIQSGRWLSAARSRSAR